MRKVRKIQVYMSGSEAEMRSGITLGLATNELTVTMKKSRRLTKHDKLNYVSLF